MSDELYRKAGTYSSTFLKMYVDTIESLTDLNNISEYTEAIYFHEYIHFLQDVTTTYGLMNICTVVDFIRDVNFSALENKTNPIIVPHSPVSTDSNNVRANWDLKSAYYGDWEGVNDIAEIVNISIEVKNIESNKGEVGEPQIKVEYLDSLKRDKVYRFGAYCIAESMAYGLENYVYPGVIPKPNKLPYESAKIICDFIYPSFSDNPLNVIALCDASLMLFNPGFSFYDILIKMKNLNYNPPNSADLYSFAYANAPQFNYNGIKTLPDLFRKQGEDAIAQFGGYFTTDIFKDNKVWIDHLINNAMALRLSYPNFVIQLVEDLASKSKYRFSYLLNTLGSPLVVNDNQELTMANPPPHFDLTPEYFFVISQIYNIYKHGINHNTLPCKMIKWCQDSAKATGINDYTDHRCRYEPWSRAKDSDPNPCPFGKVWKTWGLEKYDLQPPSDSIPS